MLTAVIFAFTLVTQEFVYRHVYHCVVELMSVSWFSHFGDTHNFLVSGGRGELAKDGWAPRGRRILGVLEHSTGSQEKSFIRKMGNRVPLTALAS
jgi:hypothetical protein